MHFVIQSNREKHDDFEGKTFTVALPKGYKNQGTSFDHFGMMTSMRPGNSMKIYFDDLERDGKSEDFSTAADWIGSGNQASYERKQQGGVHDFGFSDKTNFAGGEPGELGGTIWRSGDFAYYADRVGPLSLSDRLEASGKIVLSIGPPDSGVYFGWFNSNEKVYSPPQAGSFVGIKVGGPTHVGHYFVPAYATTQTTKPQQGALQHAPNISVERGVGPVLTPQKVFDWKVVYDPNANKGNGEITATLGKETVTLPLKPGDQAKGATLDRFGLFSTHRGGSYIKLYLDDLTYTRSGQLRP
jgi:hypothetical protein